jgi:hypothetical protein
MVGIFKKAFMGALPGIILGLLLQLPLPGLPITDLAAQRQSGLLIGLALVVFGSIASLTSFIWPGSASTLPDVLQHLMRGVRASLVGLFIGLLSYLPLKWYDDRPWLQSGVMYFGVIVGILAFGLWFFRSYRSRKVELAEAARIAAMGFDAALVLQHMRVYKGFLANVQKYMHKSYMSDLRRRGILTMIAALMGRPQSANLWAYIEAVANATDAGSTQTAYMSFMSAIEQILSHIEETQAREEWR